MIPYDKNHLIPKDGKYLVMTESTSKLKTIQFVQARCSLVGEGKNLHTAIDVNNQNVLKISKTSIL